MDVQLRTIVIFFGFGLGRSGLNSISYERKISVMLDRTG
jgi:hypothetical protein